MIKPEVDLRKKIFKHKEEQNRLLQDTIEFSLMSRIRNLTILNNKLRVENQELQQKNEILIQELEIANENNKVLQRTLYGKKSEKYKKSQEEAYKECSEGLSEEDPVNTNDDAATTEAKQQEQSLEKKKKDTTNHKKRGRRTLPIDYPRQQVIHDLTDSQKICSCGCHLTKIGADKSEQLEYIPAKIVIIEHVRYKYACKSCEETVKRANVPDKPLAKSNATASLLAHILISKFADHLPLYRQSKIWERFDHKISRATMSNWVISCGEKLAPLVELLKKDLVKTDYICSDETPLRVLSQKNKAYMWIHIGGVRENRAVIYNYQDSRSGEKALEFLIDFHGYHQCDAYSGYNDMCLRMGVIRVGCWAHVRRKFYEIIKLTKKPGISSAIFDKINALYDIEREALIARLNPEEIKKLRAEKAAPILASIKNELDQYKNLIIPKGLLGKAIGYCLNNWTELNAYLLDGRIRIDNNDCEGVIRLIALGRQNWLFCCTGKGATAVANIYSIIQTASANKVELYSYLKYTIEHIKDGMTESELRAFLPYNFNNSNCLKVA